MPSISRFARASEINADVGLGYTEGLQLCTSTFACTRDGNAGSSGKSLGGTACFKAGVVGPGEDTRTTEDGETYVKGATSCETCCTMNSGHL